MNFLAFKEKFFTLSVFTNDQVYAWYPNFDRNNFSRWVKKGLLIRLKNGVYTFPEFKLLPHYAFYFANKIYKPSYVSLHSALAFYGIIPESIFQITSVSTLKTKFFQNEAGEFSYKTMNQNLLFGYEYKEIDKDKKFKIAAPEKAIIDLIYLYPEYKTRLDILNLRFDENILAETVDKYRFLEMAEKTKVNAIARRAEILIKVFGL